jgi:hypothetical protein
MSTTEQIEAGTVLVSSIDTDTDWFRENFADPVKLPGKRRAEDNEKTDNAVSRAQAGMVIRRLQKVDATKNLPLADAMDYIRGRHGDFGANLEGKQMDFNVVNYCAHLDQLDTADDPLTVGQENLIDIHVKALLGTEPHFNEDTQAAIDKLTPAQREQFIDQLEGCTTRGELSAVMRRYQRRVPNPATTQSGRSRAAEAVANVDLDNPDDERSF